MLLIGYCKPFTNRIVKGKDDDLVSHIGLGNLLSPQMWEAKYAPRYYVPWGIILGTYVLNPIILVSPFSGPSLLDFEPRYKLKLMSTTTARNPVFPQPREQASRQTR